MKCLNHRSLLLIILLTIVVPFGSKISAQSIDEYEDYVNVEIRDTHILYTQLFQSEINGKLIKSANISYYEDNGKLYIVAQSLIKTNKDFHVIRSDIDRAIYRLNESEIASLSRNILWENVPNEAQRIASWTLTQVSTTDKLEVVINYLTNKKEIIITTVPHQSLPTN